jgi:hypothetical protein
MRLKSYLTEAVMIIGFKDLPEWVKGIMKTKKMRKDVQVHIEDEVSIGGNWHDANVREIFGYKNGKISSQKAIGGQGINDTAKERQAKKGFTTKLKPGEMILVTNTHPKMAELWAHPQDMNKMMLDEPTKDELSKEEIMTLALTKGLKAFARKEEASRYGIQFDEVKQSLIKKGYLMKNGAMNKKGKNFLLQWSGKDFVQDYWVADKLGIKRK